MIIFTNLPPSLRLFGCQHVHYSKHLVSHTQFWTGIFSIWEKKMKHEEKFIFITNGRKRTTKKKAKFMACWMLSEQNSYLPIRKTWGH